MFGLGTTELLIVLAVFIMLFGAKKIPELCKGVGEGVRHLRGAAREAEAIPGILEDLDGK